MTVYKRHWVEPSSRTISPHPGPHPTLRVTCPSTLSISANRADSRDDFPQPTWPTTATRAPSGMEKVMLQGHNEEPEVAQCPPIPSLLRVAHGHWLCWSVPEDLQGCGARWAMASGAQCNHKAQPAQSPGATCHSKLHDRGYSSIWFQNTLSPMTSHLQVNSSFQVTGTGLEIPEDRRPR